MKKLTNYIVSWCNQKKPMDDRTKITVSYGIELLLDSLVKFFCFFILAIMIGKEWEVLIFCLVFCPLRCLAGGVHMKTSLGCFFFMLLLIAIAVIFGEYWKVNAGVSYGVIVLLALACLLYAPRDTRKNPIKNEKIRKKKKYLSVALCILYGVVFINMASEKIIALVMMTMILEIITILPIVDFINENRSLIRRVEKWIR